MIIIKQNFNELYNKFIRIKKQGWIETKRTGTTGIGYTFESLLNKKEENFPIPDYKGIEIKTMHKYSKRNIHLFNATPDGDFLFPIKRILNILGYPDKSNPEYKVLNISLSTNKYTNIGYYKKVKLYVNRKEEKIDVIAIDNKGRDLEVRISWSFNLLKERLSLKLNYLAIVEAESKIINNKEYFHYNKICFYQLKDFQTFLSLIEKGDIVITFKIGMFKSGNRVGQTHDRGTDFSIKEEKIKYLYKHL